MQLPIYENFHRQIIRQDGNIQMTHFVFMRMMPVAYAAGKHSYQQDGHRHPLIGSMWYRPVYVVPCAQRKSRLVQRLSLQCKIARPAQCGDGVVINLLSGASQQPGNRLGSNVMRIGSVHVSVTRLWPCV